MQTSNVEFHFQAIQLIKTFCRIWILKPRVNYNWVEILHERVIQISALCAVQFGATNEP